jgi:hypothetical protein
MDARQRAFGARFRVIFIHTRLQLMERISQPYGMLQSNNPLLSISGLLVNQVNHVITCHMHIDHIQSYQGHDQSNIFNRLSHQDSNMERSMDFPTTFFLSIPLTPHWLH